MWQEERVGATCRMMRDGSQLELVGGDGSLKCSSLPSVVAYVKGIMAKSKNIAFDSAIC